MTMFGASLRGTQVCPPSHDDDARHTTGAGVELFRTDDWSPGESIVTIGGRKTRGRTRESDSGPESTECRVYEFFHESEAEYSRPLVTMAQDWGLQKLARIRFGFEPAESEHFKEGVLVWKTEHRVQKKCSVTG
jgi:hypothetical protein